MSQIKQDIAIKGMACAACSARLERVIAKMPGVAEAQVNLAAETMRVEFDTDATSLDDIAEKVVKTGFTPVLPEASSHLDLAIKGMSCSACSARLEKVLQKQPGITSATVNLASESAEVDYDPQAITPRDIEQVVLKTGFTPVLLQPNIEIDYQSKQKENLEKLAAMKKRLVFSLIFAVPVLVISMGPMAGLTLPAFISPDQSPVAFGLVQFFLTLPVVWLNRYFYTNGFPNLVKGAPNMDSLVAMGTSAALVYSLWSLFELVFMGNAAKAHDLYFESAAVLLALISLGKFQEAKAKAKTGQALEALMDLAPKKATIDKDGELVTVDVREIRPGDMVVVKPGERLPIDGTVMSGQATLDESMLTGEPIPVTRRSGEEVMSGAMNQSGTITVRADKVGAETLLAKIIRLVREGQGSKAPMARLADKVSLYFVPTVMSVAVISGLGWLLFSSEPFTFALRIFISVMVIACPCAMGLATPTAIMVGIGRGAQLGVLIKNGEALELAHKADTMVMDKTGTLTMGRPEVDKVLVLPSSPVKEDQIMSMAAAAEGLSEHPLAKAVVRAGKDLDKSRPDEFTPIQGLGISAKFEGKVLVVGNKELMLDQKIEMADAQTAEEFYADQSSKGKTVLWTAFDGKLCAMLAVSDQTRPESPAVVAELKNLGIEVIMLTGDNDRAARHIGQKLGIDKVISQVLPDKKAATVEELKSSGKKVIMVGDGINDAPALAVADVGVAMGSGSDIALDSGDIVLLGNKLELTATAIRLSRATVVNIKQNLFWAFAFNVIGIPVAAGVLHIFGGPTLSPMIAGGAMALSSVFVVSNALRLKLFKA